MIDEILAEFLKLEIIFIIKKGTRIHFKLIMICLILLTIINLMKTNPLFCYDFLFFKLSILITKVNNNNKHIINISSIAKNSSGNAFIIGSAFESKIQ
jgi:hypothetical protein